MESWAEIFRCFVSPSTRMRLRAQRLGIVFEMETAPDIRITQDDATIKAMKEAAQQLGLRFEVELDETK